jgi:hypothetical protein
VSYIVVVSHAPLSLVEKQHPRAHNAYRCSGGGGGYKGVQRGTKGYKGVQRGTKGYKGVQRGTNT